MTQNTGEERFRESLSEEARSGYGSEELSADMQAFNQQFPEWEERLGEEVAVTSFFNNLFNRLHTPGGFGPDAKQHSDAWEIIGKLGLSDDVIEKLKVAHPGIPYEQDVREAMEKFYIEMRKRGYSHWDITT